MAEKTAEKQSVKEFVNNHGIVIGFVIIFIHICSEFLKRQQYD